MAESLFAPQESSCARPSPSPPAAAAGVNSEIVGTGRTFTAPLGLTTVADTRAASTGWAFSASSTAFALTGTPTTTIPASAATFSLTAAPTNTVGANTYSGTATSPTTGTLVTATASGINAATLTPVLHVAVPNSTPIGVYTGTVTSKTKDEKDAEPHSPV